MAHFPKDSDPMPKDAAYIGLTNDQHYQQSVNLYDLKQDIRPRFFAAIGTDGRRPVVWGIGRTEDAAREDASETLDRDGLDTSFTDLRIVEIDHKRYLKIEGGEVNASDLV